MSMTNTRTVVINDVRFLTWIQDGKQFVSAGEEDEKKLLVVKDILIEKGWSVDISSEEVGFKDKTTIYTIIAQKEIPQEEAKKIKEKEDSRTIFTNQGQVQSIAVDDGL